MVRRAKIIATIGPASEHPNVLRKMMSAGMDIARLNFSHGTHADHKRAYKSLRKLSEEMDQPLTILQDIQGPKIRLGKIAGDGIKLSEGQKLILTTKEIMGNQERISVDLPSLPKYVEPGSRILVNDGNQEFIVIECRPEAQEDQITVQVSSGGEVKSHKGVNLPGADLDLKIITEKDKADIAYGLLLGIDAIAISFVRSAQDIKLARQIISELKINSHHPLIIAKLERPAALQNLEEIFEEVDGVMVARGDLGVEMLPEEVPIAQKRIIEMANRRSKIVITATQMLESMIVRPRPTRAEASDVANAVFDGTDALMLSGETAAGRFPVQAVEMMAAIIRHAEENIVPWGRWHGEPEIVSGEDDTYFMTTAATELAHDRNVAALAAFTESGRTTLFLSKMRPGVPILGCTSEEETYRRINIYWGVEPIRVPQVNDIPEMLQAVEKVLLEKHNLNPGQQVIFTFGYPLMKGCPSNMAYLHTIGRL